jgi:DNA-binding NarL/FixJ family response regulator
MLKVFIADDHDTCRLALKLTVLLVKKYEIAGEASSGKDLVEQILEKAPDVAIIDLSLPGKNGFEVFKELRGRDCRAKVIIWTAHMDKKTVDEAVRLGVDGYLCKGATTSVMAEALAAVLAGKKWIDPSVQGEPVVRQRFKEHPSAATA